MKEWIKIFEAELNQVTSQQTTEPISGSSIRTPGDSLKKDSLMSAKIANLMKIIKADYPNFIASLGQHANDAKFRKAIRHLSRYDRVDIVEITPTVYSITPTQNEIDITKSLVFPLTKPNAMREYLGSGPVAPNGYIVTSGGGKYIIDGHHRWSQVYVCNPKCKILAHDMSDIKGPFPALKSAQLGIAAATGKVPSEQVQGINLLTASKDQVIGYIIKTIVPQVLDVLREFRIIVATDEQTSRIQAAEYLWKNCEIMQQHNQPIAAAPQRGIMPQTDTAKTTWDDYAPNPETTVREELSRIRRLANISASR